MADLTTPSVITIGELTRIIKEFEEKIKAGTEDPDRFLTLAEIEQLWGMLIGDTNVLYSNMLQSLIQDIDEKELVRKKKEYREKGISLRTHRRAEKEILTLHGKITYSRNILIPADKISSDKLWETEHIKSIVPLDCALGISRLPFKMTAAMMLRCAYWAQNQCSYQAAEEAIEKSLGLSVNDDTIRLVTNYIGRLVFLEDCRRADETMRQYDTGKLSYCHSKEGTIYIEVDGAALNTRHRNEEGSTWRENKLGVMFSTDYIHFWKNKQKERVHQIQKREYISYVGGVEEFKKHVFTCAVRNGYGSYKNAVILSDGAAWIANMAEELFPDAQHILDYFHLCENVHSFGRIKFRTDEEKYRAWSKGICEKLKAGKWQEVLESLDPEEKYENCVNLYHYISTNQDHIKYPEYESKGYFIGSGAIESGNKVVLQKRLKQAGMRWEPETAQYILTLKTKQESNLWEKDVVQLVSNNFTI